MKFPPVRSRIDFEGIESAQFWVRVFRLEEHVALGQRAINEKLERKRCAVPIINEYTVDSDHLIFCYAMSLTVDAVGLKEGVGVIFVTDKENYYKAIVARNKIGELIMAAVRERFSDEELEGYIVEPGKESH